MTIDPRLAKIDHFVVVLLENRSFDHYLGYLRLHGGRGDLDGPIGNETNPWQNKRIGLTRADASRIAAFASTAETPSISNRMRPGLMTATQPSGAPLPLPMRVSCGFLVMGLSGNTRIHTLPPRLMPRVNATRAASICRSVSQHGSSDINP